MWDLFQFRRTHKVRCRNCNEVVFEYKRPSEKSSWYIKYVGENTDGPDYMAEGDGAGWIVHNVPTDEFPL